MQTMNDLGFTCHAATVAALVWKNLLMIYKQMGIAKSASTELLFTNLVWDVARHSVLKPCFPGELKEHYLQDMGIATVKTIKLGEAAPWKNRFREN